MDFTALSIVFMFCATALLLTLILKFKFVAKVPREAQIEDEHPDMTLDDLWTITEMDEEYVVVRNKNSDYHRYYQRDKSWVKRGKKGSGFTDSEEHGMG